MLNSFYICRLDKLFSENPTIGKSELPFSIFSSRQSHWKHIYPNVFKHCIVFTMVQHFPKLLNVNMLPKYITLLIISVKLHSNNI